MLQGTFQRAQVWHTSSRKYSEMCHLNVFTAIKTRVSEPPNEQVLFLYATSGGKL